MSIVEKVGASVSVRGLRKSYGTGDFRAEVLVGVDLEISSGECVAVMGASGSGKSTLLHCLAGVDVSDSGAIIVDGNDFSAMSQRDKTIFRRRNIGLVFQAFNLVPLLNVAENISCQLDLDGRTMGKEELEGLLAELGMADRRNYFPNQLSGGQQQRTAIGRALAPRPALVLADEPTGNLDRANGQRILDLLLSSTKRRGATLVMITHDEGVASRADRVLTMRDGRIV